MSADFNRDFSAFEIVRADNKTTKADTMQLQRKTEISAHKKGAQHEEGGRHEEGQSATVQSATKGVVPPVDPRSSGTLQSRGVPQKCSA